MSVSSEGPELIFLSLVAVLVEVRLFSMLKCNGVLIVIYSFRACVVVVLVR